jgi:hypothetical protein
VMPSDSLPVCEKTLLDHVRDTVEDIFIPFFVLFTVALSLLFVVVVCKIDHVKNKF